MYLVSHFWEQDLIN